MMNTILSPTESIDDVKTKGPLPLPVQLYWVILILLHISLSSKQNDKPFRRNKQQM